MWATFNRNRVKRNMVRLDTFQLKDCFEADGALHMVVQPCEAVCLNDTGVESVPVVNLMSGSVWNCRASTLVHKITDLSINYNVETTSD
jgi:hypothetical protein